MASFCHLNGWHVPDIFRHFRDNTTRVECDRRQSVPTRRTILLSLEWLLFAIWMHGMFQISFGIFVTILDEEWAELCALIWYSGFYFVESIPQGTDSYNSSQDESWLWKNKMENHFWMNEWIETLINQTIEHKGTPYQVLVSYQTTAWRQLKTKQCLLLRTSRKL